MKERPIGTQGLRSSPLGLGCMGMSHVYGPADDRQSIATVHRALDLGVRLFDTADVYGLGANETLLGQALARRRDEALIATKFGMRRAPDGKLIGIDGSPAYVREACAASLRRLGVDYIDLYYLHRIDPNVPVEETVGAMAELVTEGKVAYLGLSEAGAESLRRAHAVHPISALQSEYSLATRDPEESVLAATVELGIGFVAYSPFGRGLLTGTIASADDLAGRDYRRSFPRFQGEHLAHNAACVARLADLATEAGASIAQLALAWLLCRNQHVVPIPGTRSPARLAENVAACALRLDERQLAAIEEALPPGSLAGDRFRPAAMERVGR